MQHLEKVEKFVFGEIGIYSFFEGSKLNFDHFYDGWEYFNLEVHTEGKKRKELILRADAEGIEVGFGEDCFRKCDFFDEKEFWKALLSWDLETERAFF